MGSISTRAGTVAVRTGPLAAPLSGITDTRPNLPPQQPADHRIQIRDEIRLACVRGRSVSTHHKKATARKAVKVPAHQLPKAPLHPVPGHRRPDRPADHESYPGWLGLMESVGPNQQVPHHRGPAGPGSGAHGQRELGAVPHPGLGRQDQALSRSRPLRLRAARTARPARVRMRSRKPCVFARRRLFGWNVRLLTGTPGKRDLDHAHAQQRAALGFPTGYHLEHRRLPGVSLCRVLGCGKLSSPSWHRTKLAPREAGTARSWHRTVCRGEATCTTCG